MSKKYEIHPNQIKQWKKDFLENGHKVFERGENSTEIDQKERLISELYRQIGELKVDCDFLKKSYHKTWEMVEKDNKTISVRRQSELFDLNRSGLYYKPVRMLFMYLFAIIDVYSRYVVGWSLSNTMTAD